MSPMKKNPCTACGLCVPQCPMELNIPALLKMYNETFIEMESGRNPKENPPGCFADELIPKSRTGSPDDELTPAACVGCGASGFCSGLQYPLVF